LTFCDQALFLSGQRVRSQTSSAFSWDCSSLTARSRWVRASIRVPTRTRRSPRRRR
jgi:hypothetical protein